LHAIVNFFKGISSTSTSVCYVACLFSLSRLNLLFLLAFLCLQISVAHRRPSLVRKGNILLVGLGHNYKWIIDLFHSNPPFHCNILFVLWLWLSLLMSNVVVSPLCWCFHSISMFLTLLSMSFPLSILNVAVDSIVVVGWCQCRCRCHVIVDVRCSMYFAQLCLIICCCIRFVCSQIMGPQLRGCETAAQSLLCNMGHPCCPTRGQSMLSPVVSSLREPVVSTRDLGYEGKKRKATMLARIASMP